MSTEHLRNAREVVHVETLAEVPRSRLQTDKEEFEAPNARKNINTGYFLLL
jgi:hypothetical protein